MHNWSVSANLFVHLCGNVPYFISLLCLMPDNLISHVESAVSQWLCLLMYRFFFTIFIIGNQLENMLFNFVLQHRVRCVVPKNTWSYFRKNWVGY